MADNQTASTIRWNIFYHMHLDSASLTVLVSHCQKLLTMSAILNQWCSSPYSHFIGICTQYTLTELRHHWSLYEAMQSLSPQRISVIERAFSEVSREAAVLERHLVATFSSARSTGPLMAQALRVCGSFMSEAKTHNSKLLNPMFAYSLGVEGCSINSIADPLVSFHLASALGNSKQELTIMDIVVAAKTQFEGWCSSFHKAIVASESAARSTMIVRFFVGKVTAVCHSLRTYSTTRALAARLPVAKWNTHFIVLDQHEYLAGGAPTMFNVIDTSNLDNHIGCLNVLITSVPLLPASPQYFVLYTESLLFHDHLDATKEFTEYLHTDLSTLALLVGICPVGYISGFSSHWMSPSSANDFGPHTSNEKHLLPIFDTEQLGTCLYDMYRHAFKKKKPSYLTRLDSISMQRAFAISNLVTEIREAFEDKAIDHYYQHNFYTCSHLHGVHTADFFAFNVPKFGLMADWDWVSSFVRIILIVLETPLLQCEFKGTAHRMRDIFTSVHAAFGTFIPSGIRAHPSGIFTENPKGRAGSSPLVTSFVIREGHGTEHTSHGIEISQEAGIRFFLFSANLMDSTHHILPEQLFSMVAARPKPIAATTSKIPEIGYAGPLMAEMDEEHELVSHLTCWVSVDSHRAKDLFSSESKLKPGISQKSSCVMRLSIGKHAQDIKFPFPIIGSQNVLCLARKSLYIEIVVPISGPFCPDRMKLNPFPVVGNDITLVPWSFHQLNLARLPVLDINADPGLVLTINATGVEKWVKSHFAWMLSDHERKLTKTHENNGLAPLRQVFALRDKPSTECDTIIFINAVKFNLASHTLVCDRYVLPLIPARINIISSEFGRLIREGNIFNLLPAFAERCRSWKHTSNCEYVAQGKVPLSEEIHFDPLCSCGHGKDMEGMAEAGRCFVCRGKGKPKMKKCASCQKTRYCSEACQRKDWKGGYKAKCKSSSV
ncbi:hypothetical protein B0H13DRAFT_2238495 [Mycena leptocephala]|nr:hypothetical protein B0H13DRAFT_2238495 [Mycena leptocephala]